MFGKISHAIVLMVLAVSIAGCGTIYKGAMDERSVGQQLSDASISTDIMAKYADDKEVSVMGIEPYTFLGDVYLVGEYESHTQKNKAVAIAKNAEGVKNVTTYLLPEKDDPDCGMDTNVAILAEVTAALVGDGDIWSTNVNVKVVQCRVVLLGLVGSQAQVDKSIAHAKAVEGVRSVKSYLRVSKKQ